MTASPALSEDQRSTLERAIRAVHDRTFFAHFPESPSPRVYGETANAEGQQAYDSHLGGDYDLLQESDGALPAREVSPFTQSPLGITYPVYRDAGKYVERAGMAFKNWKHTELDARAAILMDSLDRIRDRFFELGYATMHTTGQGFVMAFQSSGPHALDRALEALALGYHELSRFPQGEVEWVKPMGKFDVKMRKRFRNVPKGVALAIGCSTFPVWNTIPAIYANLITGNPTIVKPHPGAIYPIALVVDEIQRAAEAAGVEPEIVQLASDVPDAPITKTLAEHADVRIIDFTGSSSFGSYLADLPNKVLFTEMTGVNSVILDSAEDLKMVMRNLGFSLALYSGQMCTAPQNIFVPREGVRVSGALVPYEQVVETLTKSVRGLIQHEKMGPGTLGAIQNPATADRVQQAQELGGKVLMEPIEMENPEFPEARIATNVLVELQPDQVELFGQEMFGPIAFVIPTSGTEESVRLAKELAQRHGAISCAAYTTDSATMEMIEEEMSEAGAPVSFNFTGAFWVNQNAGFSDFHVTGGNPAGNASLTDPNFVRRRFTVVGSRVFEN